MNPLCVILALAVSILNRLRGARQLVTGQISIPIVVAFSVGLLALVAAGAWYKSPVLASPVDYCSPGAYTGAIVARDGQKLTYQAADVQALFESAWGQDAAARWVFEHNCILGSDYPPQTPSLSDQCPYTEYTGALEARDGLTLSDQTAFIQNLFVTTWGTHAPARWVYEHNCALGPVSVLASVLKFHRTGQSNPQLGSGVDQIPTPTPEPSSNSDSNSGSNSDSNSDSSSDSDPGSSGNWQGYYVEDDIGGSWDRMCQAFMDYKIPPDFVYESGNEALFHPLMNVETSMYLEECQRSPR